MKPLVIWTLRQRKWSIFWWCAGIIFFILLELVFYPTFKDQAAQLNKSFSQIPETAKQLFTDTNDLFSPLGYLSSQIFYLMMPMLLGILAINQGMSLLGKEENNATIELLLSRPVSRGRLLSGKAAAGLFIVALVTTLSAVFTAIMCKLVGLDIGAIYIIQASLAAGLMALSFGAVAFLLTALGRAGRAASIAIATAFALGGYIISSLAPTVNWLRWPAKLFPFNYYHSSELLTGRYNWANAIYFAVIITACMTISWLAFRRRDLLGS